MLTLLKTCITCGKEKEKTDFYPNGYTRKDGSKKIRNDCKDCCRSRRKQYFQNPDKRKKINQRRRKDYISDNGKRRGLNKIYALKNLYGLTFEQFEQMLKDQNNKCAICGKHENEIRRGLFVDHNRETKEVRGLLCQNCNAGIGHFKESESLLYTAINYLSKMKSKKVG